jgi:hypothetical protein
VNLCFFPEEGQPGTVTRVPFVQERRQVGNGIYCLPIP